MEHKQVAVIGCGLGGAAMTALLQRAGYDVAVFEQAPAFGPVGAGIHLSPNLMHVMRFLELDDILVNRGFRPDAFTSRAFDTGEIRYELPLQEIARKRYGGDYLTIHRGDFHAALISRIASERIHYGKQLTDFKESDEKVTLAFADGTRVTADLVVAADGVSSRVRNALFDPTPPNFSGQVAYRSIVKASDLPSEPLDDLTKWWADDRFVIAYYLDSAKEQYYFVAGFPADHWPVGTSTLQGSREELLATFADFHPAVREIFAGATDLRKWPLFERPPCERWHQGRVVMLGDASHPMRPHMAQGAAMAIEDAVTLVRCLAQYGLAHWEEAFQAYFDTRIFRTATVQEISGKNTWLRDPVDPGWLFSHNASAAPLRANSPDLMQR